jgi:transposase
MRPKRVTKNDHKWTLNVDASLFERANKARVAIGYTWRQVIEAALRNLVDQAYRAGKITKADL